MGKMNSVWQDKKQQALDEFFSGATNEEAARHELRRLGLDCDEAENELWAVKNAQEPTP